MTKSRHTVRVQFWHFVEKLMRRVYGVGGQGCSGTICTAEPAPVPIRPSKTLAAPPAPARALLPPARPNPTVLLVAWARLMTWAAAISLLAVI